MQIHQLVKDPTGFIHRWVLDFELAFFNEKFYSFIVRSMYNWWWLSIPVVIFYILLVFIGQLWMNKKKEKYELRQALILWNTFLSIFSLWGACRTVPELIYTFNKHGFIYSVCDPTFRQGVTGLWIFLFMLSKVPETLDTLFIVLRRQPLIFLHWYHHASVLVYCFYSYGLFSSTGHWFAAMNYCVHTIMYSYFALRAARISVPRSIAQLITILQIIQMIAGCIVNLSAWNTKEKGYVCSTSKTNIILSLALYASYFILFAHFFYVSYVQQGAKRKTKAT